MVSAETVIRYYAQNLTPRERLEADRWNPPQHLWKLQAEWEQLNPGTKIDFIPSLAEGSNYEAWLTTQMTGGTAPDIVWYQRGYINRDYRKGWFVNLSPFLEKPNPYVEGNERWMDIFEPQVIASGMAPDGNIYLLTGDIVGTGFFYNKDIFDELGLAEPDTWDEFFTVQQKIKEAGYIPFAGQMQDMTHVSWTLRILQEMIMDTKMSQIKGTDAEVPRTWKPGEAINTKDMVFAIMDGRYSALDPQWQEQLRIFKYWTDNFWQEGFMGSGWDDLYRLWVTGKAAIMWHGSWQNKPVQQDPLREFDYGIFGPPRLTKETSPYATGVPSAAMGGVGGVFQYAVTQTAVKKGHLDKVIDWLMYVTAPQNIGPLLTDHGGFAPGVRNADVDPSLQVYTDQMVIGGTERIEPYDSMLTVEFWDRMVNLVHEYLGGKTNLEETSNRIQKEMERNAQLLLNQNQEWKKEYQARKK